MKADEFNKRYKVGQLVTYADDFGTEHATKTRSIAWETGCGTPIVKVEGITGGYDLKRITPYGDES